MLGRVTECDPPRRLVFTWRTPDGQGETEVEVQFRADGDGTRLSLEHRGWERIGPGAEKASGEYVRGWDDVLGHYAAQVG